MTRLRCWPGCLAYVTHSEYPENLGRIVEVLRRADPFDVPSSYRGEVFWDVRSTGAPLLSWHPTEGDRLPVLEAVCMDVYLRPITPPPGTSETTTDTPADAVAA